MDLAVRPCLPMILPTSVGSTLRRKRLAISPDAWLTETLSGRSTNERAMAVINSATEISGMLFVTSSSKDSREMEFTRVLTECAPHGIGL